MRSHFVVSALITSSVALSACDAPADEQGNTIFRRDRDDDDGDCLKLTTGTSGTGKLKGVPDPTESGALPILEEADPEWIASLQTRMVDSAVAAMALTIDRRALDESCSDICHEADLAWSGQGCIANAAFTFGGMEYGEFSNGDVSVVANVEVNADPGCACN